MKPINKQSKKNIIQDSAFDRMIRERVQAVEVEVPSLLSARIEGEIQNMTMSSHIKTRSHRAHHFSVWAYAASLLLVVLLMIFYYTNSVQIRPSADTESRSGSEQQLSVETARINGNTAEPIIINQSNPNILVVWVAKKS